MSNSIHYFVVIVFVVIGTLLLYWAGWAYGKGVSNKFYKPNAINLLAPGVLLLVLAALLVILPEISRLPQNCREESSSDSSKSEQPTCAPPQWQNLNKEISINVPLNRMPYFSGVLLNDVAKMLSDRPKLIIFITPHGAADVTETAHQLKSLLIMKGCQKGQIRVQKLVKRDSKESEKPDGISISMKLH